MSIDLHEHARKTRSAFREWYLIMFVGLGFLIGCRGSINTQPMPTYTRDVIFVPNVTNQPPIVEPTETGFTEQSEHLTTVWESRCGSITQVNTSITNLSGHLVVYLAGSTYKVIQPDWSVYDLNISTDFDLYVSPNGQWLSYWQKTLNNSQHQPNSIEFVSFAKDLHYSVDWQDTWILPVLSPWFSSDYMNLLSKQSEDVVDRILLSPENNLLVFDWSQLPDITLEKPHIHTWLSPSLNYLAYQTNTHNVDGTYIANLVLWDVQTNRKIWESPDNLFIDFNTIVWSPNSNMIAFTGRQFDSHTWSFDLFVLSVDGSLMRQTEFDQWIDDYILTNFKWSLNSEYLLFILGNRTVQLDGPYRHPLILDVNSGKLFDYCIEAGYEATEPWSPDSSTLAFIGTVGGKEHLLIVDINKGNIYVAPFDVCSTSQCEPLDSLDLTGIRGWLIR